MKKNVKDEMDEILKTVSNEINRAHLEFTRHNHIEQLEQAETKETRRKKRQLERRLKPYNAYLIKDYVLIREHNYMSMRMYDPDTMLLIQDLNLFIQLSIF
jgi:hypothetical protein